MKASIVMKKGLPYLFLDEMDDKDIRYKNFAGNPARSGCGKSSQHQFTIRVPEEIVPWMRDNGVPVDERTGHDDGGTYIYYNLYVVMDFRFMDRFPCKVYYAVDGGEYRDILEDQLGQLDEVDFTSVKLMIRMSTNANSGKTTLYLHKGLFDSEADEIDEIVNERNHCGGDSYDGLSREAAFDDEEVPFN